MSLPVAEPGGCEDDRVAVLKDLVLPLPDRRDGKVRMSWALPDAGGEPRRLFVTTDRLSAFDRVLGCVAGKGQVLNELAAWWFNQLNDLVATHLISVPDPNALVARAAQPLSVEVVVRGAITGVTSTSLWKRYSDGARVIDGHRFLDGLQKNALLPEPIITPTTKAVTGGHDEPLSCIEVVTQGLVEPELWERVCAVALAIFERGSQVAASAGLILADTKYEFGLAHDGTLMLIDEVHTPDSSRYWLAESYGQRISAGQEPQSLDKEIIRKAYAALGYRGESTPPELPDDVWRQVGEGYSRAFIMLTGREPTTQSGPIAERIIRSLTIAGLIPGSGGLS